MFAIPRIFQFLQSRLTVGAIKFFPGIVPADFFATASEQPSVFPLSLPADQRRLTYNGTAALYQAAVLAGIGKGDQVLLPAYCCGSELGPFEHLGCDIRFYKVTDELQVDVEDLFSRVNETTKLVYVTHYFGTAEKNIEKIAAECERRKVPLLEDCALCLYVNHDVKPLGSFGDFAI
ncbi:MAG: DegT/DnrJ/EryC1/StrS family aminotransferase, partial [Planctomycetota bacterium]